MPTVSMFYGILIRMYYDDHNPPHFHAFYNGMEAIIHIGWKTVKRRFSQKRIEISRGMEYNT